MLAAALGVERRVRAADGSVQASWVSASALEAPDGVRRAVSTAIAAGITTIVAPAALYSDTVPDRFMELLRLAHEHQLQVHAAVDIDRAALADEVPASRSHVIYQHPEWLMVPRALAPELLGIDVRSPEYVGRLARWARTNGLDGIYLSPLADDAAAYVAAAAARVLRRYPVDGVQLDAPAIRAATLTTAHDRSKRFGRTSGHRLFRPIASASIQTRRSTRLRIRMRFPTPGVSSGRCDSPGSSRKSGRRLPLRSRVFR